MIYESFASQGLIFTDRLRPYVDERVIRTDVARGRLIRLRRGVYVDREEWEATKPRAQHVLRIRAVLKVARRPVIVAGFSAAALWGMPIAGDWPDEVTILDEWLGGGRSEPGVRRTAAGFRSAEVVEIRGIRTTGLARTALDIARVHTFVAAVGSVDWALSRKNPDAVTQADLMESLERLNPRRGRSHMRECVRFARSLSDSYGESTARAVIHTLWFEAPELQVELRDAKGRIFPDFLWRRAQKVAEFDGKVKYTREQYTKGDPAETVWQEKKREDRVRQMGFGVARIVTEDTEHPALLEAKLVEAGVPRRGGS